jgi:hypothetical protein
LEIFVIDRLSLFVAHIAWRKIGVPRTSKDIVKASDITSNSKVDLKVPIVDPIKSIAEVANKASLQGLPNIRH